MTPLRRLALLGVSCVLSGPVAAQQEADSSAPTAADTGEAAALVAKLDAGDTTWDAEALKAARTKAEDGRKAEPTDARWVYALAMIEQREGQRGKSRDLLREAVKLDEKNGLYRARLGSAIFSTIQDASGLDKMSWADDAVAQYQLALELDATLIEPRIGLSEFYINAPGIAGGSYRKAKEQADALLALPDNRGEFHARLILAKIAAHRERWKDMSEQYTLAESARGEDAKPYTVIVTHANELLTKKKDPTAALAVIERASSLAEENDTNVPALRGIALFDLKRYEEAVPELTRVVTIKPEARRSRLCLAQALEKLNRPQEALAQYQAYLEHHPKNDEADDARAAIKRLEKKLAK